MKVDKNILSNCRCEVNDDLLPGISAGDAIPKIIHQTFPHRNKLTRELTNNIEHIKALNPDWEYRLYDDREIIKFIDENYGRDVLSYYLSINPAYGVAKADLFRYLCLYKCGGVYIDIKGTFTKPLSSVIRPDDRFLLSQWRNKSDEQHEGWGLHPSLQSIDGGEFQQWYIVAIPGHPFLRSVIKSVLQNIASYKPSLHGVGFYGVLTTTGPIAYTLAIAPMLDKHPHRFVDITADAGFQYSIYDKEHIESYRKIFKSHYTSIYAPIVKMGFVQELTWNIFYILKYYGGVIKKIFMKE